MSWFIHKYFNNFIKVYSLFICECSRLAVFNWHVWPETFIALWPAMAHSLTGGGRGFEVCLSWVTGSQKYKHLIELTVFLKRWINYLIHSKCIIFTMKVKYKNNKNLLFSLKSLYNYWKKLNSKGKSVIEKCPKVARNL